MEKERWHRLQRVEAWEVQPWEVQMWDVQMWDVCPGARGPGINVRSAGFLPSAPAHRGSVLAYPHPGSACTQAGLLRGSSAPWARSCTSCSLPQRFFPTGEWYSRLRVVSPLPTVPVCPTLPPSLRGTAVSLPLIAAPRGTLFALRITVTAEPCLQVGRQIPARRGSAVGRRCLFGIAAGPVSLQLLVTTRSGTKLVL